MTSNRTRKSPARPVLLLVATMLLVGACATSESTSTGATSTEPRRHRSPGLRSEARGAAAPAALISAKDVAELERRVHERVNAVRRDHGLEPLSWSKALGRIARRHSEDMVKRGYFGHVSPDGVEFVDRYRRGGLRCEVKTRGGWIVEGGENVFLGNVTTGWIIDADGRRPERILSVDEVAAQIVDGWMASAGHRENILERHWKSEGIGIGLAPEGEVLVTQNFC